MTVHLRLLDLPGGPDRLALLTLDSGDPRRPFVLGPASLPDLADALDRAEALAADGEVIREPAPATARRVAGPDDVRLLEALTRPDRPTQPV